MTAFCPPRTKNKPHRVTQPSLRTPEQSHNYSTSTTGPRRTHTPPAPGASHVRPTIEEPNCTSPRHRGGQGQEHRDSYLHPRARPNPFLVRAREGRGKHRCSGGSGPRAPDKGRVRQRSAALLWRRVDAFPREEGFCPGTFSRSVDDSQMDIETEGRARCLCL